MATSGSVDYSVTRDGIINFALKKIGVLKTGGTGTANQVSDAAIELELLAKSYQTYGLQMWARKQATLFPQSDTHSYSLGPSGDNCTGSYVKTEIATAASSSDTSITVDSITGISNADYIGVKVDDGSIHWTTVNGAPSGSTITLTTGLDDDAAVDNEVYAYTDKINRPLKILDIWLHNDDGTDQTIDMISLSEYSEQSTKTTDSTINEAAYQPTLTNGTLFIWAEPSDTTSLVQFWYQDSIEDFDSSSNNPYFPQEWYLPLGYGLASLLCDTYGVEATLASRINARSQYWLGQVLDWDNENTTLQIEPDLEY